MIATKIKCDSAGAHVDGSYIAKERTLGEAIMARWWELKFRPGVISFRQPATIDTFQLDAKHACCAGCARQVIEDGIGELIVDDSPA